MILNADKNIFRSACLRLAFCSQNSEEGKVGYFPAVQRQTQAGILMFAITEPFWLFWHQNWIVTFAEKSTSQLINYIFCSFSDYQHFFYEAADRPCHVKLDFKQDRLRDKAMANMVHLRNMIKWALVFCLIL